MIPFGHPTKFIWNGDHNAIEEWADKIVRMETGKVPSMSIFTGDCHGVYIEPERLREVGLQTVSGAVIGPARHGDLIRYSTRLRTFLMDRYGDAAETAPQTAADGLRYRRTYDGAVEVVKALREAAERQLAGFPLTAFADRSAVAARIEHIRDVELALAQWVEAE